MFGADTPLVMDALQMSAVIAGIAGAAVFAAMRWRAKHSASSKPDARDQGANLEERVQVLERIATDRSGDLADEIEALRDNPATTRKLENAG